MGGLAWMAYLAPLLLLQASTKADLLDEPTTTSTTTAWPSLDEETTTTTTTLQPSGGLPNGLSNLIDQIHQMRNQLERAISSAGQEMSNELSQIQEGFNRSLFSKADRDMITLNDVMVAVPCKPSRIDHAYRFLNPFSIGPEKASSVELSVNDCQKKCDEMGSRSCRFVSYFGESGHCYRYETAKGCRFMAYQNAQVSFRPLARVEQHQYGVYRGDDIRAADGKPIAEPMSVNYCRLVCALIPDCTIASWFADTKKCYPKRKNLSENLDASYDRRANGHSWKVRKL